MVKLPDSGILLHIGAPKTGTTSIQRACYSNKFELRKLGILYPGSSENHNRAVARPAGYTDDLFAPPDLSDWKKLVGEVRSEKRKVVISSELLSVARSNLAQRIVDELGEDRVHVLLTVRPLAFLFPSIWQQDIKSGFTESLDVWMKEILRGPYAEREHVCPPWIMANFAEAVHKWKNVVGPNRFSVLMVEPNHPAKLIHDFEDILSLPHGFLVREDKERENRSLTYQESEFFRHINIRMRDKGNTPHPNHISLSVPLGAIVKFVERVPAADEERPSLPLEILEKIVTFAKNMRDQIVASGVNIIGDIDSLMKVPPSRPEGSICGSEIADISLDVALSMVEGITENSSNVLDERTFNSDISTKISMDVAVSMVENALFKSKEMNFHQTQIVEKYPISYLRTLWTLARSFGWKLLRTTSVFIKSMLSKS